VVLATIAWPLLTSAIAAGGDAVDGERTACARLVGVRDALAARGLRVGVELTYAFQGIAAGGVDGPLFARRSGEEETGNVASGTLELAFETEKAGWWRGGTLDTRLEARVGRSILQRAGTVSAVDNDALFPNVVAAFDDEVAAVTKLSFTQRLGERLEVFAGLLDAAEGDANALAGSALSNEHFLNSALLYSLVEDATVPNVAFGGGLLLDPTEEVSLAFSVFGTEETAGTNPFAHVAGTTFSLEGTVAHTLLARAGAQTFGALYGIDARRVDIAADPRLGLAGVLAGDGVPDTSADTWALYYNAHQFFVGDDERGAGLFMRVGFSDGDPNPVRWNWAGGFGGRALLPARPNDTWAVGAFYLGLSHADLLKGLQVGDEVGGEMYYSVAVKSWLRLTVDAQVVDSALPHTDTVWVLGIRTQVGL
jgi:porin